MASEARGDPGKEGWAKIPSVPTAVATGGVAEPGQRDAIVPVRPVATGLAAGVIAAVYVLVVFLLQPVPARALAMTGGASSPIELRGGIHVVWQASGGERHVMDIPGVAAGDVAEVAAQLTGEGLQFREVLQVDEMSKLATLLGLPMKDAEPIDLGVDQWREYESGRVQTDYYLLGTSREAIEQALDRAHREGWQLPAGATLAFERIEGTPHHPAELWRSYVVADHAAIDGRHIAYAEPSTDPNTGRPIVLVNFDREGAVIFGDVTARIRGHKLAILVGDQVKSAPVIEGAIRGGRASITMGTNDIAHQQHERDVLVATLSAGVLPPGARVVEASYRAPIDPPLARWLARALLSLGIGALVALLVWALVHATRPVWQRSLPRAPGGVPWTRIAVTLLAPAVVLALSYIPVPFIDTDEWREFMNAPVRDMFNLASVGLMPIVTAYLVVAVAIAIVPPWRRRRFAGAEARRPFTHAVVLLAIVLTAVQAWFIVTYLQSVRDVMKNDGTTRLVIVALFELATAVFAITAAVIRARGLGNGFGALIAGSWMIALVREVIHFHDAPGMILFALQIAIVAIVVGSVLRWRIVAAGEAPVRVPTSGIAALGQAAGLAWVMAALVFAPSNEVTSKLVGWVMFVDRHVWWAVAITAVVGVLWSLVFARPNALHRYGWTSWRRATLVSIGLLLVIGLAIAVTGGGEGVTDAVMLGVVVAVAADLIADARRRRGAMVRVWSLHDAQHADLAERALGEAAIPCHLSGANLRAALAGFGPFAVIDVHVAAEHAEAAAGAIRTAIAGPAAPR